MTNGGKTFFGENLVRDNFQIFHEKNTNSLIPRRSITRSTKPIVIATILLSDSELIRKKYYSLFSITVTNIYFFLLCFWIWLHWSLLLTQSRLLPRQINLLWTNHSDYNYTELSIIFWYDLVELMAANIGLSWERRNMISPTSSYIILVGFQEDSSD